MLDTKHLVSNDKIVTSGQSVSSPPSVSLPKGGGAIRGIGEKFAANPVTGTGSLGVPIATSPGRSDFGPQLSLSYDSGAGNGPFGLGWSLSIPQITRKTDKGLPQYRDADESDVFILSGAEDLVPVLVEENGVWIRKPIPRTINDIEYQVQRYRPRIEGLFARIERWTNTATGEIHWRSISKDNITTLYGKDNKSRIFDPTELDKEDPTDLDKAHPTRIFSWLICQSYDDKGNAIVYEYQQENPKGVDLSQAHQLNRTDSSRSVNRYLKRIKYGNRVSRLLQPDLTKADWMFEVVFDYDEGHYLEAKDAQGRIYTESQIAEPANTQWTVRQDPFSSYRAGFEVRTYRLCRRVLMFHHFPQELGINDCLVRSTEFRYRESPIASFITSVSQSGYLRQAEAGHENRYLKKSLPPLEFEYSQVPEPSQLALLPIREVDAESLENLPIGLDGANYQWMDLDGEGTYGILTEQATGWFYKRNLSANNLVREDAQDHTLVHFGPMESVASKPIGGLAGGAQFLDLAGDGQIDLVQMEGPARGFYERTDDADWEPFQPFISWPNVNTRDPNLKFVDLNGDGHADILLTEDQTFTWYPSLAEEGFGPAERVAQPFDEEQGPRLVFADGTQSIYLADFSGDGLTDLVRIRNGEMCYWPNLGYGCFGAKVSMDNAPWFDAPDQFDQRRIRLADTDGSGTADILYLHREGVRVYFNECGNRWSDAAFLPQFPPVDNIAAVQTLDLLGNGTACLVWSSPLPGDARRPLRYIALMEEKPHLMVGVRNNLGAETIVHYAPSTKFYLDDKRDGKPWITRLPFPVHVVDRVETYDYISRNRFVTRYTYHHGYFDGVEREFRGFGRVDQWDTENFAALSASDAFPTGDNIDAASHVPPVYTKTWFHTGVYLERNRISTQFAKEYYGAPASDDPDFDNKFKQFVETHLLPDTVLPEDLSIEEERETCRALKGLMLRQEVYGQDGTDKEQHPYTVTEQNFAVRRLQLKAENHHAVFLTHARESLSYHYERNPIDPRIGHALTLEVDDFSNVRKSVAIGYGRQIDASSLALEDREKQRLIHITYTENSFTQPIINSLDIYRIPLSAETCTYELRKPEQEKSHNGLTGLYRFDTMLAHVEQAGDRQHDVDYEDIHFSKAIQAAANDVNESNKYFRRLIERVRTLYRPDDCGAAQNDPLALLTLGIMQPLALSGETYKLAFTPGLLAQVFQCNGQSLLPNPVSVVGGQGPDRGGYVNLDSDGCWWIPSGRQFYSPIPDDLPASELAYARQHFFLPHRYRDPFHTSTVSTEVLITYDSYDLLLAETCDPLDNRVTVGERDTIGNLTKQGNDYRVLQPELVMDPNRNRTEVAFDALGMVVGTAVMGKPAPVPVEGDSLDGFRTDLTQAEIDQFLADPRGPMAATLLDSATTRIVYDLTAYWREPDSVRKPPAVAATVARETHVSDLKLNEKSKLQVSLSYSDGFGREIQKKAQAEADNGIFSDDVLADHPIAYYRLNESAGAVKAIDSSGNGNHGSFSSSGSTLQQPGLGTGDTAALFDGHGSGRIIIPDSQQLIPTHITMEALISWSGPIGSIQQRILEKSYHSGSPTESTYGFSVLADGSVHVELAIEGIGTPVFVTSETKLTPNVVTHLAATFNGSAIEIYVNGRLDVSVAVAGKIRSVFGSSDIGIGNQVERDRQFNGVIDEVALYDKALPADRIRSHFAKVKDGNSPRRRWVGSGWTIFNNKGKPVRQYEPFFSATHSFEFGMKIGVSPVLFYDPVERVVATLHPNHTYEKVVFDPWQQITWDVNDTVTLRPDTDSDVQGFFVNRDKKPRIPQSKYSPTWYELRAQPTNSTEFEACYPDVTDRLNETSAALKAAAQANTPTAVHFDALGRPFLTVTHNKVQCKDHRLDGAEDKFNTRIELDIEGNQRAVRDAATETHDARGHLVNDPLGRVVMRYDYDMLGNRIHQLSMEAGARWTFGDVVGNPLYAWDSRGHIFRTEYDPLRRPLRSFITGVDPANPNQELLTGRLVYGEQHSEAEPRNLRGKLYLHLDQAGSVTTEAHDFKGNPLSASRRLTNSTQYRQAVDWQAVDAALPTDAKALLAPAALEAVLAPRLEADPYTSLTTYDALNRPVTLTTPHTAAMPPSIIRPGYNEANLLERVDANLRGATASGQPVWTPFVSNIDYDAKGQRQRIDYGNGASTFYDYDPLTFRLSHLYTCRRTTFSRDCDNPQPPPPTIAAPDVPPPGKPCGLQNLYYTYDPVGNITYIRDDAQQTIYFAGQVVPPHCDYTYDAIYCLITAEGREHIGQVGQPETTWNDEFRVRLQHPGDGQAMRNYIEVYEYDAAGNFEKLIHQAVNGNWTRSYAYNEDSLIEPAKQSNRLSSTTIGKGIPEPYTYDAHGNMMRMNHLPLMQWDYRDQLQATAQQVINNGVPETTWYFYDASGQRVRKVTENAVSAQDTANGKKPKRKNERIYLGGFEIYRDYENDGVTVKLERETLHIMDDTQRIVLVETRTHGKEPGVPEQIIRYQFGNHLGSASLELDEQAQIISYEEYTPYGSTSYQAVRGQTETPKRYRYTGKECDEESGLYYYGARYYVPWLGRWTTPDPAGTRDSFSLYVYVADRPTRFIDPQGSQIAGPESRAMQQLEMMKQTEIPPNVIMVSPRGPAGSAHAFGSSSSTAAASPSHTSPQPVAGSTVSPSVLNVGGITFKFEDLHSRLLSVAWSPQEIEIVSQGLLRLNEIPEGANLLALLATVQQDYRLVRTFTKPDSTPRTKTSGWPTKILGRTPFGTPPYTEIPRSHLQNLLDIQAPAKRAGLTQLGADVAAEYSAFALYHELKHAYNWYIEGGKLSSANQDKYLYPSADKDEQRFIEELRYIKFEMTRDQSTDASRRVLRYSDEAQQLMKRAYKRMGHRPP